MKHPFCLASILLLLLAAPVMAADPFPFVIPWDDAAPSMTDVSFLNDGPAGSHGFIIVKNGHFAESGSGKRVRFFAVNLAASSAFPTHADAQKVAGHLAKYGVNLVRLHHMDNNWNQRESLIDFSFKDHQHLNPQQLDRLDYLIYQLKLHGIYSNINLHVSRTFSQEDGFPASVSEITFDFDKRVDYFDGRMRELEKKYAHDLLTHVNPYTHTAYVNEPAVLNAEITNEDTLIGDWWTGLGNGLADLPEPFGTELRNQWDDWLGKKYASTAALQTAWTAGLPTNGPELLKPTAEPASWTLEQGGTTAATMETGSQAITESINILAGMEDIASWTREEGSTDVAASMTVQDGILTANVTKIDPTEWHVQVAQGGLDLQEGKHYTLSFRAKADAARDISVATSVDQADWHNVGLGQPVHLTTDWQTYHLPFTAAGVVRGHTRVVFSIGGHTGVIQMAEAALREDLPAVTATVAVPAKALKVNVTEVDPTSWHVQLHQVGLNLKEGETYTLRFLARADSKRNMSIYSGLDQADWHHTGLDASAQLTGNWKTFQYLFTAHDTVPDHGRIAFILGSRAGKVWLADVSLRRGLIEPPVLPGQSPAMHNIPIPPTPFRQQRADWLRFLEDTERGFAVEMRNYLKDDLHFKPLVICSQVSYGGLAGVYREAPMDFVDNHSYWQHPSFPHRAWDPVDWNIGNTSMVSVLGKGDELSRLAKERVAGKPYTVSEYNHPAPNEYQSETVPLLASFAAFQDWDALYLFDYGGYGAGAANDKIQGFFAVNSNPAKWAFVPAAAMIFRAGETPLPSRNSAGNVVSTGDLARYSNASELFREAGTSAPDPFSMKTGIDPMDHPLPGERTKQAGVLGLVEDSDAFAISDPVSPAAKSPLTVTNTDPKSARYTADGPTAKVVAGFVGGQTVTLGDAAFTFGEMPNNFASLTLTAQDQRPLATSGKMLLTVADRVENTGMVWNAAHTSVGSQWGTAPTVADGVTVGVSLRTADLLKVFALDATGKRDHPIIATYEAGGLHFEVGPKDKTLWYAIVKE